MGFYIKQKGPVEQAIFHDGLLRTLKLLGTFQGLKRVIVQVHPKYTEVKKERDKAVIEYTLNLERDAGLPVEFEVRY